MQNTPNSLSEEKSISLHVSGIPFETTEEDILNLFKDYKIKSVKILK
jgi:RNA recognition motif-containing protein